MTKDELYWIDWAIDRLNEAKQEKTRAGLYFAALVLREHCGISLERFAPIKK